MNDVHGENIPTVNAVRPTPAGHRLFVAAFPPDEVVEAISSLPRPVEPGVRWVPPERWHATLRFLGDADPQEVAARLARVDLPAATASVGPSVSRLGPDVVVVPVAGLDDLAGVIERVSADLGGPPDPRPFTGHLTLARLRRRAACGVAGMPIRGSFPIVEVCLVDSRTEADGLRYDVVERLPVG